MCYETEKDGDCRIYVQTRRGKVYVNDKAKIIDGDILGNNGVIQVIDEVLFIDYLNDINPITTSKPDTPTPKFPDIFCTTCNDTRVGPFHEIVHEKKF